MKKWELEWELSRQKTILKYAEDVVRRLKDEQWAEESTGVTFDRETWRDQAARYLKEKEYVEDAFKKQKELLEAKDSSIEALWQDKSMLKHEKQDLKNDKNHNL